MSVHVCQSVTSCVMGLFFSVFTSCVLLCVFVISHLFLPVCPVSRHTSCLACRAPISFSDLWSTCVFKSVCSSPSLSVCWVSLHPSCVSYFCVFGPCESFSLADADQTVMIGLKTRPPPFYLVFVSFLLIFPNFFSIVCSFLFTVLPPSAYLSFSSPPSLFHFPPFLPHLPPPALLLPCPCPRAPPSLVFFLSPLFHLFSPSLSWQLVSWERRDCVALIGALWITHTHTHTQSVMEAVNTSRR